MIKKIFIVAFSLVTSSLPLISEEPAKTAAPAPALKNVPPLVKTQLKSTAVPVKKKNLINGPIHRNFELRAGLRVSQSGGDLRFSGKDFEMVDDLGWDSMNVGTQVDADWQPYNRFHVMGSMNWDNYDQSGTTSRNLRGLVSRADDLTYLSGSTTKANFDIYTFDLKAGWDVVQGDTYSLTPYLGGRMVHLKGKASVTGTLVSALNGSLGTVTTTQNRTESFLLCLGGVDQRVYITRRLYAGLDLGGTFATSWYGFSSDIYAGWDLNKTWGLRAGYGLDWMHYEPSSQTTFAPYIGAGYVQVVWGF
jgi:hypothetical protein